MLRGSAARGRSKATGSTVCQKCLQRGHYSYECTVTAQQRPYKPRPSRTQQLLDPKLKPKLTTEVPNDLLRKTGVADELLAKKEEERRGKRSRDDDGHSRKRSRSISYSSDSASTISTNRSPSRPPSPPRRLGKRSRRSASVDSQSSKGSTVLDRNTRRRMSSFSPPRRGRRRSRSGSSVRMETSHDDTSRHLGQRRHSRTRSHSRGRGRPRSRSRSGDVHAKRTMRRASNSLSRSRSSDRMETSDDGHPPQNGVSDVTHVRRNRWGASPSRRSPHASLSPPKSSSGGWEMKPDPSHRGGRSPSPYSKRLGQSPSPYRARSANRGRNPAQGGRAHQSGDRPPPSYARNGPPPLSQPAPPRERSLSPYSKRVALTRAMQAS
ncbi:zinc knuckle-domain-containing protein [Massariosphaeria phaeospora]|uniref:Zinc knuckle-domain-containing protein n=1 Tax=Massariosphaeria phaeospora TaxID=100035 RepID=A0A7C8M935_9PLEO|nr:zinc knuckle-domain-containing protein [Massariosphaeria phaeospora]